MTRTGKIARLPREIRAQLNRRIQDGESGRQLVQWLNSLPEAQTVLQRDFAGRPINEPNLTDWKQGGYLEWLAQQDALRQAAELAANAAELSGVGPGLMSDHLATVLVARYAGELAAWNGNANDESRQRLRVLRDLCHDVVELRRSDHSAASLKIEQALLDRDQEETDIEIFKRFLHWIEYPKVHDCICAADASPIQRLDRLRELLGIPPDPINTPEN
jgi:hypothetical protein